MKTVPQGTGTVRVALTQNELECAVDAYGLAGLLEALQRICVDKAEHLESNWQDKKSAQLWDYRAAAIEKLVGKDYMKD